MSFQDILQSPPKAWENIYVNSINFSGVTGGQLATYFHTSLELPYDGPFSGVGAFSFTQVGDMVTMNIPVTSLAGGGTAMALTTTVPISDRFIPNQSVLFLIMIANGGTGQPGILELNGSNVGSPGIINIYGDDHFGPWEAGQDQLYGGAISYNLTSVP